MPENSTDKGFALWRSVLVIVSMIIIGGVIWLVWLKSATHYGPQSLLSGSKQSTTMSLPTGSVDIGGGRKAYTYPGSYFRLTYPQTWSLTTQPIYNASPFSIELNVTPSQAPTAYAGGKQGITIRAYKSADLAYAASQFETTAAPTQSQYLTINGYKALFQQYAQSPSANNETYTDDIYAVNKGSVTVVFYFRVSESAMPASAGLPATPAFDQSSLLPQFNSVVASISF